MKEESRDDDDDESRNTPTSEEDEEVKKETSEENERRGECRTITSILSYIFRTNFKTFLRCSDDYEYINRSVFIQEFSELNMDIGDKDIDQSTEDMAKTDEVDESKEVPLVDEERGCANEV